MVICKGIKRSRPVLVDDKRHLDVMLLGKVDGLMKERNAELEMLGETR